MSIKSLGKYHLDHCIWLEINSKPTVRKDKLAISNVVTIFFESKLTIGFPGGKAEEEGKRESVIVTLILMGMIEESLRGESQV